MKKLLRSLAAALVGMLLVSGTASAQTISNGNGTGSTNTVTKSNSFNCSVNNTNNVNVTSTNNQNSSSGSATSNSNTTVGNVGTGSASNRSSLSTSVVLRNGGCLPASVVTPPVTPPAVGQTLGTSGGRGAVLAAGTTISALPATGETTAAEYAVGSIAVLSGLAIAARASTGLRRELAL